MPHCIIEYSQNIEEKVQPEKLLDTVFNTVAKSPLFEPQNVSARLYAHKHFCEGNHKKHFIHVAIKLYAGRSEEDKLKLTHQVGEAINQFGLTDILISCECVETEKKSMFRALVD